MALTFIHAADLHLDSPLRGLTQYAEFPADRLRAASRRAFTGLVDKATETSVDFMILAGDIWDGQWQDIGTGLYFVQQMGRLQKAGIPVYLLRGNHDAESVITKALPMPDNVHIFSAESPETYFFGGRRVALHGQSFNRPDVTENLALHYPPAVPDCINIGVLHTALEGNAAHANYAPCLRSDLLDKGYDYWALGHVHTHMVHHDETSGGTLAYPGVLQGRHIREAGAKGALIVRLDGQDVSAERLLVDVVRWHELSIDVSAAFDLPDVEASVSRQLREFYETQNIANSVRTHIFRLVLSGNSNLGGWLALNSLALREAVLGQLAVLAPEQIYLEKIKIDLQPLSTVETAISNAELPIDLRNVLGRLSEDSDFLKQLSAELHTMISGLPPDVQTTLRDSIPERMGALESEDVTPLLPDISETLVQLFEKK